MLKIHTADISGAGTNEDIYLGIGGRGFCIDSKYASEGGIDRTSELHNSFTCEAPVPNTNNYDSLGPYKITEGNIEKY